MTTPTGTTHFSKFYDGAPMDFYKFDGETWRYWANGGWCEVVDNEPALDTFLVEGLRKCCVPTAEEEVLLATGEYTPEELWGGRRPTCPKCIGDD